MRFELYFSGEEKTTNTTNLARGKNATAESRIRDLNLTRLIQKPQHYATNSKNDKCAVADGFSALLVAAM